MRFRMVSEPTDAPPGEQVIGFCDDLAQPGSRRLPAFA